MNEWTAKRAAKRGDLPTITLQGVRYVPTAKLYALLGLDIPPRPPAAARPVIEN